MINNKCLVFYLSMFVTLFNFIIGNALSQDSEVLFSSVSVLVLSVCVQITIFSIVQRFDNWLLGLLVGFFVLIAAAYCAPYYIAARITFLILVLVTITYCKPKFYVRAHELVAPLGAAFACVTLCLVCERYTSFNMLARLSVGDIHQDTLFHASIASMVKTYGVFSTGLSGTIPISYHVFSHVLFAGVSNLSGVPVFQVYGITPTILLAPIFIAYITLLAFGCRTNSRHILTKSVVSVAMLCIIPIWLGRWGVWLHNWIGSESNLVALCLLFGVIVNCIAELNSKVVKSKVSIVLFGVAAFAATSAKGPLGIAVILAVLSLYIARRTFLDLFKVVSAAIGFLLATVIVATDSGSSIKLLSFLMEHTTGGGRLGILLAPDIRNVLGLVIAVGVLITSLTIHFLGPLTALFILKHQQVDNLNEKIFWRTFILGTVVVGIMAVSVLHVGGGSESYFSNIPWYFCSPLLASASVDKCLDRMRLTVVFVCLLAVGVASLSTFKYRQEIYNSLQVQNVRYRRSFFVESLVLCRNLKGKLVLNVTKNIITGENPIIRCTARPFIYPAISEKAWTGVIESNTRPCKYEGYGYRSYGGIVKSLYQHE
jgi:hypothetical protein